MCYLLLCAFVGAEGSVKVLSAAKENWVPQSRGPVEAKDSTEGLEIKITRRQEEDVKLDDGRSSQAAWILQYMEQQEEVLICKHVIAASNLNTL